MDSRSLGLGLRVGPRSKTWFVRYYIHKDRKEANIGAFPAMGVAAAREKAAAIVSASKSGRDILKEEKATETAGQSVSKVLGEYYESYLKVCTKDRTRKEVKRLHDLYVVPRIGKLPIGKVVYEDLYQIREAVRKAEKPVQSNRVVAAIKAFFRWAHEDRRIIPVNPSDGLKKVEPEASRDRYLSMDELAQVWIATDRLSENTRAYARLLILTAARRDEIRCMDQSEVDFESEVWTLPADRNKTGVVRKTPLTPEAIAILEPLVGDVTGEDAKCRPLLPGRSGDEPITNVQKPLERLRKLLPDMPHWTWHDIRRTVATQMANLGVSYETRARVLGHSDRQIMGITAVYSRSEHLTEKRDALELWEAAVLEAVKLERTKLASPDEDETSDLATPSRHSKRRGRPRKGPQDSFFVGLAKNSGRPEDLAKRSFEFGYRFSEIRKLLESGQAKSVREAAEKYVERTKPSRPYGMVEAVERDYYTALRWGRESGWAA